MNDSFTYVTSLVHRNLCDSTAAQTFNAYLSSPLIINVGIMLDNAVQ